jgi:hypothetical protein
MRVEFGFVPFGGCQKLKQGSPVNWVKFALNFPGLNPQIQLQLF